MIKVNSLGENVSTCTQMKKVISMTWVTKQVLYSVSNCAPPLNKVISLGENVSTCTQMKIVISMPSVL